MPSFLNPLILIGLAAAFVPLLIHLFTRRRLKMVEFSSVWFLKDLEKTRLRQVKLKNLLLLLIRTLILILIVLAFARPALKGQLAGLGKAAASSVVILMDDSYSMATQTSQGSLFELAQKKGLEILNQLSSQDECAIIYAALPPESASFSRDFGSLKDSLSVRKPSFANSNFKMCLEQIAKLMATSSNLNRELYVLTNKSILDWEKLSSLRERMTVYWFRLSAQEIQNLSIPEVDFGRQLLESGRAFTIKATLVNHSLQPAKDWLVGFYLDQRKVAQTDVTIPGRSKSQVQFTYTVHQPGFHSGYIDLAEDDLVSDNYRFFVFKIPDRIKILIAGQTLPDNHLLELALKPEEKLNLNLEVNSVSRASLEREELGNYDVVILNDLKNLSEAVLNNLGRYLETGGGVWIILGRNADRDFYSQKITQRFYSTLLKKKESSPKDQAGFYQLENWDLKHPVFSIYQEIERKELPQLKFYEIHKGQIKPETKILAFFSGKNPALLETAVEKGKAMLLLAGLDTTSSDVSRHPFFVPWVNRMVGYLAQDIDLANQTYTVGEIIQRELGEIPARQTIELVYPNQTKESLTPIFSRTTALVKIENTSLPGVYQIRSGERVLDAFAVNLDARESEPEQVDLDKMRETILSQNKNINLVELPLNSGVAKFIQRTRYGRELWRETLILALVLLGAEMWLGKSGSKRELT